MNEQIIERTILNSVAASPYSRQDETTEAYIVGARMMYEFLRLNPHLLEADEAEKFFQYCLFPSKINY